MIDLVAGARPNWIKIAPLYRIIKDHPKFKPRLVYTGQHHDPVMSSHIYKAVGLPGPHVHLGANRTPGLPYLSHMIERYDKVLQEDRLPRFVIVVGDTDSTLAGAVVAKRNHVAVGHVEAGLRTREDTPEDMNRRMVDSISDMLWAPTYEAQNTLFRERPSLDYDSVGMVGNIMIDSLMLIEESSAWKNQYSTFCDVLVTVHRPANVDNKDNLKTIIKELDILAREYGVFFPVHPRTQRNMKSFNIEPRDYMSSPMEYPSFLKTMSRAKLIITDSGGVSGEASYFGKPCVAIRKKSGWVDLVRSGCVILVEDLEDIVKTAKHYIKLDKDTNILPPLWDGHTAERIVKSLEAVL